MVDSNFIYLDNHSTTRCDPAVVDAMLPLLSEQYANIQSSSHEAGRSAAEVVRSAVGLIANAIGAKEDEIVVTSGATESNNLALQGVCLHPRQKRKGIVTLASEHHAVLDPVKRLSEQGFDVACLPVAQQGEPNCGRVDLDLLADAISDQTAIVSVMLANNEIGVIQDLKAIAEICHRHGALLHSDATQAVGRIDVDVEAMGVDLLSASAHKFYGPKGIGFLYVRRSGRRVRLRPMIEGGGQQQGLRSGTINGAGVVAMGRALQLCEELHEEESVRIDGLANRLWETLSKAIPGCQLNGPARNPKLRLVGNLNICFPGVEGDSLMAACASLALSSGSACSSLNPEPSHVLLAIGLSESEVRRSLRVGIGRFNTAEEIDRAAGLLVEAHTKLVG